ncbi:MAG TPA: hypothetical protein VJH90_03505 [archaeon]|nr:hypothetical protein [archaeon]
MNKTFKIPFGISRRFGILHIWLFLVLFISVTPVEAATAIDNDGSVTGSQNKVLQDSTGEFWAIWYESNNRVWITRTDNGVWQTKQLLAGPSGSGAFTTFTNPADVAVCWNTTRTRLHVILYSTLTETRYTTLLNLANWNQSAAWVANDESTQGSSSISNRAPGYFECEVDSANNIYVVLFDWDTTSARALKRQVDSPFTWTESSDLGFGTIVRGMALTVTSNNKIYVASTHTSYSGSVAVVDSTNPSDITAFSSPLLVINRGGGASAYDASIMERSNNTLVVFSDVVNYGAFWNYYNGASWTQGTTGSNTGVSDAGTNPTGVSQRRALLRDGLNETYVGYYNSSGSGYHIKLFNGTNWNSVKNIDVGASDSTRDVALEPRTPPAKSIAGILYVDLEGGGTDILYFDNFTVNASGGGSAPTPFTINKLYLARTYQSNGNTRSFFAQNETVDIRANITNSTSGIPTIDIYLPNGTRIINSQNMTNATPFSNSNALYNYTFRINESITGWYSILFGAAGNVTLSRVFYVGPAWNIVESPASWQNSTGTAFPFRLHINISEQNGINREFYPVDRWVNFTSSVSSGASNNSVRTTYYNGSHYIEIPSQLYNQTLSGNTLLTANLAFLTTINASTNQSFHVFYSLSDLGAASYQNDLTSTIGSSNYTLNNSFYSIQTNTSIGNIMYEAMNGKGNNATLSGANPIQNSPHVTYSSGDCPITSWSSPTVRFETGPILLKLRSNGTHGTCSLNYDLTYIVYSMNPYTLIDTNITETNGAGRTWDAYTDQELRMSDGLFAGRVFRNNSGIFNESIGSGDGGDNASLTTVNYTAFYSSSSRNAIGDIFLTRIQSAATTPTADINDESSYDWWRRRIVPSSTSVGQNSFFYTRTARVLWDAIRDYEPLNETFTTLTYPVVIAAVSSVSSSDSASPQANLSAASDPASPTDQQSIVCYSHWTDDIGLFQAIGSHNATGSQTNTTITFSGGWANFTIDSSITESGTVQCNITAQDNAGNANFTQVNITVTDVSPPQINNITYMPNTTAGLDPNVPVNITANITEFNATSIVILQYGLQGGSLTNVTMTNNTPIGTSTTYNASFTPGSEANWTFRIFANDTQNSVNISSNTTFNASYERTWSLSPSSFSETSILVNTSQNVVNMTVNNTGDFDLYYKIEYAAGFSYPSEKTYFNVTNSSNITVANNTAVVVNATLAAQDSPQANVVKFSITALYANGTTYPVESTNPQTTQGTIISYQAGPFLYIDNVQASPSGVTAGNSVNFSARIRNLGNETAINAWMAWSIPSGWTITSGSANKTPSIGDIFVNGIEWNNITVSVASTAATGTQRINITANSSTGGYYTTYVDVTVTSATTTTTTTTSTASSPSGGGGGVGGLSAAQKTKLIQTEQIYEIVGGGDQSFLFTVTNPFNGTLKEVRVSVAGFLSQYISITPPFLGSLGIGESYDFTVLIKAPEYFTRGNYNLTFTIRGSANETKTSGNTTYTELVNLLEDKKVLLGVHEISRTDTLDLMNKSVDWIAEMRNAGLNAVFAERLFNSSQSLLLSRSYEEIRDNALSIESIRNNGFKAQKLLADLESAIHLSEKNGVFVTETPRIISLAKVAFLEGDFATALQHLESAQLTFALETKGELNPVYFLLNNWQQVLLAGLFGGILLFLGVMRFRIYVLDRNLGLLAGEEGILLGLMKQLQKESFEEKKMSMEEYLTAMQQYENKLSEAVQRIVEYETLRSSIFRLRRTTDRLKDERDRLYDLMTKTQSQYMERKMIETHIYQNKMRSFATRLSEVEEMLAFKEAQRAIRESKSAVWRAYYRIRW